MQATDDADTIRILVSTDNHVGYSERDAKRGDDSWQTFDEIMRLAKEHDVDMVLLAGDLFHDNNPSRKAMYQVMRSLRLNCYGEKPCALEMLSDASENFGGAFTHANYEDEDINVAIPVFSIHGNHDDPSGEGHFAALDLLQVSGLVNYYGKTPESDNIVIKPVLLQKGRSKLALYGMSNVRDERLFRTFRDGKVKFFQPGVQKNEWFNLMSVHQNRHAYTETSYLPENFLPGFLDLVIWGHEHECLIDPHYNPEMGFHVIQPGSSVATSLMPGEAVPKHVTILSVTGKQFECQPIRLKSVRPFMMKEIVLQDEKRMKAIAKKENNRTEITRYLSEIVKDLISEANESWQALQVERVNEKDVPHPLIRLRVEYTAPEGGKFDCENPQRFSRRFDKEVANITDVIQFYRKKSSTNRHARPEAELPEESVLAQMAIDAVKVEKLVREFLTAQSLTILPQNSFGDAVSQFVDKDDKYAMEMFVNESLTHQIKHLMTADGVNEDDMAGAISATKSKMEQLFASGQVKLRKKIKLKPKPDTWDSDIDGHWSDEPGALVRSENEDEDEENGESVRSKTTTTRGRGRGRGRGKGTAAASTRKTGTTAKAVRGKNVAEEKDEDNDVLMIDDDDDDIHNNKAGNSLFVGSNGTSKARSSKPAPDRSISPLKKASTSRATVPSSSRSAAGRQTTLTFSQPATQTRQTNSRARKVQEPSEDEISDDDDAFEPAPSRSTRIRN
ncbi:DNA repair exonuclease [Viridothelium virens]|uniref:Double-strand break repair protein n=1 Tax=Viridothelium virens TaxID=1048519 RepID=A0A6A6HPF7_VIRVR|nr:DNA repair exonuclease [Viridothelium virens]